MSGPMIRPCARSVGLGVAALALLANCGESVGDRFAPLPGDDWAEPYSNLELKGEEAAMRTSASCDLSFMSAPPVAPSDDPDAPCPCTRRAGPKNGGPVCVQGAEWGVAATVGPEGANLLLRHTPSLEQRGSLGVLLRIPPGALSEPTVIRIIETSVLPPAGFADATPVYVFEPVGLQFATPASLEMPWDSTMIGPFDQSASSALPTLYWSSEADACALEPIADNYVNAGFNQGTVTRLGWAAVGRPLPRATPACP
jgi:hypothetical protein